MFLSYGEEPNQAQPLQVVLSVVNCAIVRILLMTCLEMQELNLFV